MLIRNLANVTTGLAAIGVPVGYLVAKHINWERPGNPQKRMMVHQATFWATFLAALYLIHKSFRIRTESTLTSLFAKLGYLATASILPIAGFEGGSVLGRELYPRALPPTRRYLPSYLA